jgi:hypothetical protein
MRTWRIEKGTQGKIYILPIEPQVIASQFGDAVALLVARNGELAQVGDFFEADRSWVERGDGLLVSKLMLVLLHLVSLFAVGLVNVVRCLIDVILIVILVLVIILIVIEVSRDVMHILFVGLGVLYVFLQGSDTEVTRCIDQRVAGRWGHGIFCFQVVSIVPRSSFACIGVGI